MSFSTKRFFCWLLVLIVAISPVRLTMAIDLDQSGHGSNCQESMLGSNVSMDMNEDCLMEHEEHCHDHPACVGHLNTSAEQSLNSLHFASRTLIHVKFLSDTESVQTVYPSLLKRPPKA